jgi:iron complex transport system ATP-binding protein
VDAPAYIAQDVHFTYPGTPTPVLSGVDLELPAGGCGALLGPNGCGKSTLLRLLLGRLAPSRGEVRLFGRAVKGIDGPERARLVGYLPQEVTAAYAFTVEEVVLMGRWPHLGLGLETPHDHDVARDCLARTDTTALAGRAFGTLSGGEKQRVLLASVLAQEPRVLLLDEPTAALDIHHQHEVMELLTRLRSEGLALCVVTHDLNLAARYCPLLWLLHGGRVVASGTPAEVLSSEALSAVYGERLRVVADPDTGGPLVLPPVPSEVAS